MKRRVKLAMQPPLSSFSKMGGLSPRGMKSIGLGKEQSDFLKAMAISIFVDMTNAGQSFHNALTAIYLSGLLHGKENAEAGDTP